LQQTSGGARPAKPKAKPRSAKGAKAEKTYDNKLYREFERPGPGLSSSPEDNAFMREYCFRRRHLAWGRADTGHRRLKYEIESDWFFELMDGGLEFIKERDGEQIFNEVSRRLLIETLELIQYHRGSLPKSQRSLLKELIAERYAEDDKIDAYLRQLPRRGISTKAIAA
jgi:hypothetical protein